MHADFCQVRGTWEIHWEFYMSMLIKKLYETKLTQYKIISESLKFLPEHPGSNQQHGRKLPCPLFPQPLAMPSRRFFLVRFPARLSLSRGH